MKLKSILTVALVAASIMVMAGGNNVAMAACAGATGGTGAANTICTTTTGTTGLDGLNFGFWAAGTANNQFGIVAGYAMATDALGVAGSGTGLAGGMPAQVAFAGGDYTSGVGPTSGYLLNQTLFSMCSGAGCAKFIPIPGTDVSVFGTGNAGNLASYNNATGGDGSGLAFSTIPAGTDLFNQGTFETGLVTGYNEGAAANIGILSQKTYHHNYTGVAGSDGDYIDQRLSQQIDANGTTAAAGQQKLVQNVVAQAGAGGTAVATLYNEVTPGPGPNQNIDSTWIGNADGCGQDLPLPQAAGNAGGNCGIVSQTISDTNAGAGINGTTGVVHNGSYGQIFNGQETVGTNTIAAVPPVQPNTTYTSPAIAIAASALTIP